MLNNIFDYQNKDEPILQEQLNHQKKIINNVISLQSQSQLELISTISVPIIKKHMILQGTHFLIQNGKLVIKQLQKLQQLKQQSSQFQSQSYRKSNYKIIPYNHLNKPTSYLDYHQETIKKLNQQVSNLKKQRRQLLDLVQAQRKKNQILFQKINDLDQQSRILKNLDEGDKTKRYLYKQFMYSQAEVRKIRLDYQKKLRKMEKQHIQEIQILKKQIQNQQKSLKKYYQEKYKSKRNTLDTEQDQKDLQEQNDDRIGSLKPLCLNLNSIKEIAKKNCQQQLDNSFEFDFSQNGKSNQSTARKLLKNMINEEGLKSQRNGDNKIIQTSMFLNNQKENKSSKIKKSSIKTARVSVTQKIWK